MLRLCPWTRQKNYSHRCDADQSNDENVVAMGDEAKPTKGMTDVCVGAMRAADGELPCAPCAGTLPAEQCVWQLRQRTSHEMELWIEILLAVRTRLHRAV